MQRCTPSCRVLEWLKKIADNRKLKWVQDKTGNLVIRRPGSGGGENAAPVIVQVKNIAPSASAESLHAYADCGQSNKCLGEYTAGQPHCILCWK